MGEFVAAAERAQHVARLVACRRAGRARRAATPRNPMISDSPSMQPNDMLRFSAARVLEVAVDEELREVPQARPAAGAAGARCAGSRRPSRRARCDRPRPCRRSGASAGCPSAGRARGRRRASAPRCARAACVARRGHRCPSGRRSCARRDSSGRPACRPGRSRPCRWPARHRRERRRRARGTSAPIAAMSWITPISLLTSITDATVVSGRSAARKRSRSSRPLRLHVEDAHLVALALELAHRVEHRLVLGFHGDQVASARPVELRGALECEVVRFGGARGPDDLARLGAHQRRDVLARRLDRALRPPSPRRGCARPGCRNARAARESSPRRRARRPASSRRSRGRSALARSSDCAACAMKAPAGGPAALHHFE